jgi:hypothetical protein
VPHGEARRARQIVLLAVWVYAVELLGLGPLGVLGIPVAWVAARRRLRFALPVGVALLVTIWIDPLARPNHHFVLLYLIVLWGLNGPDRHAARWLYVALMAVATLQKLAVPAFRDGSFIAWLLSTGRLPQLLFELWTPEAVEMNRIAVDAATPHIAQGLLGPPGLAWWGRFGAWGILLVEGALAALGASAHRWFGPLAVLFVVLLPVMRFEFVFACILSALTALATAGWPQRLARSWTVVMAIVACLAA